MIHSIYQLDTTIDKPFPPKEYELKKQMKHVPKSCQDYIARCFRFTLHPYMTLNM